MVTESHQLFVYQHEYQFQCGINRLLNVWFKASSWCTSQTPLPSCLLLYKASLAAMFPVTDCPLQIIQLQGKS